MAQIHLVCGPVGAGKTTFALQLCRDEGAIHFSIDHWMTCLFTPDLTGEIEYRWAMERIERVENVIWGQVVQLITRDMGVVLDLGLLKQDHRQKFYALAQKGGFDFCLHLVEAQKDVRWQRVLDRNAAKGDTYRMDVDRGMFDFCEDLFERPFGDELNFTLIHQS